MPLSRRETWEQYRRRMLRETERFIEWGLKHPEHVMEIPAKPAGRGGWPKKVGEWFWAVALYSEPRGKLARFREALLRRPRHLIQRWK